MIVRRKAYSSTQIKHKPMREILSTYHVPGIILGVGEYSRNKINYNPCPHGVYILYSTV